MEALWSMYNKVEKLRIDGLKTEHVRIILLSIPTRRMEQWYACREGDMQWRNLSEITEFYEDVRTLKGAEDDTTRPHKPAKPSPEKKVSAKKDQAPPSPAQPMDKRRPLFEEAPVDLDSDKEDTLVVVTSNVTERRSSRRYPRRLDFTVSAESVSFSCETHDISMNGLSLNEPLPRWVPRRFRAKLAYAGVEVKITCARVSDSKLQITDSESWDVIRQWIVKW